MTDLSACPACAAAPLAQSIARSAPARPTLVLSLPGLHCPACIGKVERALMALPGVAQARVNLSLKRVSLTATGVTEEACIAALDRAGYEAHPLDPGLLSDRSDPAGRALLSRLAVSGFAMMNVMLLSVAVWSGATDATRDLFHMISAAIALPVVAYAGQPFFFSALRALRGGGLNMDVPISLAILLASAMSLYETFSSGAHAYFDAALSLTFFLLIGRYLDHRTRRLARSAARDLTALEDHSATRIVAGQHQRVPLSDLAVGDRIAVATGMRVPVDGRLISARAVTDQSFLTGESAAVTSLGGADLQAGAVNLGAPFEIRATAVGCDTTLRRVAALVETAESSRNRYTALADRAARIYAPVVHLLALVAFVVWLGLSGDVRLALNIAIAVLIITCPCALGLAVPAVATAAIGTLFGRGVLVTSGSALERLAEVDHVIFDKTGTLTLPGMILAPGFPVQTAGVARALAQASTHPVSRAVAAALTDIPAAPVTDIDEIPGCGVTGRWQGRCVRLGRADWLGGAGGGTLLQIGTDAPLPLPLRERLRTGAAETVRALQAQGLTVELLSGDRPGPVAQVAGVLGITAFRAGISAEAKHARLTQLAETGRKVLMIGDGLNDTAALAAAHASVAPSSALDAARNAADVLLLRDGLDPLPGVLAMARRSVALARGNFKIAALYNMVAVPVACLGFTTPLLAALAMSASSITVLINAMRVRGAT